MATAQATDNGEYQVLIVGAGPIGLLLANFLGQKGISCLLVDKRISPPEWSRAIGVTPPSLSILEQVGCHTAFAQRGVHVRRATVHDDYGPAGDVSFDNIDAAFRYILAIPQAENMDILEKHLEGCGSVTFERGWTLTNFNAGRNAVNVELTAEATGNRTHVSGKWLVGCDGSNSTTRDLAGIPFQRAAYGPKFVMADYYDTTPWQDDAHLFFTRAGSLESFPLPDNRRRWIALVTQKEGRPDAPFLEQQAMRLAQQNLEEMRCSEVFDFCPERLEVHSLYQDRVILAGDAAHVMSPIGGQGMNTGFGDVEYLANIVPRLLENDAEGDELLRMYNRCRQKAAASSRRRTTSGMWLGTRTGWFASIWRSLFLRGMMLKGPLRRRIPAAFAMLTIPYSRFKPAFFPSETLNLE